VSELAPLVGALALVVAPCVGIIWMGLQHWRGGPDRPWSARLRGLARASAAGLILALLVLTVVDEGPWPPATAYGVVLAFLTCAALFLAARITAAEEARRTRRIDVALGLPVPRRLVPPVLIGVIWLLVAVGGLYALVLGAAAILEQRLRAGSITLADADARIDDVVMVCVVWGPFCFIAGGLHVWYQSVRRGREVLKVHQARLELPASPDASAGGTAGRGDVEPGGSPNADR
jgi:hypothetical protein